MAHIRRSPLALPFLLGLFFLSLYLLTGSSDLRHNGDTDLRYQTTQAMVDYHRLWIADPMWKDTRVAPGIGGHLYAFYAPGQPVFMIPLYVAGKFLAHHLSLPYDITTLYSSRSLDLFLGAALAVLFFLMARTIGYSARVATVLTLIFGLATVAWPDAQSALEQTQVDLFLLLAVYGLWNFAAHGMDRRVWLVLAGTAVGLAVFTRYDAALYVPVIALFPAVLRWRASRRNAILGDEITLALAGFPWVALVALWNIARFGSPFRTGLQEKTLGEPFWQGFLGLIVSPGKGLIWYLPLVLLLPWAVSRFYRWRPALSWLFAALALLPLLFYSNLLYWHGDPAWGPRYLYTAVPYLILPLGTLLASWRRERLGLRLGLVGLLAGSMALNVAAVSVTQWRFWYRLEAMEEHTSQPFAWGATHYHYYWNVRESPMLMQFDDVYQVVRLNLFGDQRYREAARPTAWRPPKRTLSNPADNYPVNTLAFWWADTRHPLLGARTRTALASGLAGVAAATFMLLLALVSTRETTIERAREVEPSALERATS